MFEVWRRFKVATAERFAKELMDYLARNPENNIRRMLDIGISLALLPEHKEMIGNLRRLYETDPTVRDAFRRLIANTNAQVRNGFILNLVLNATVFGIPEQRRQSEELGIQVPYTILIDPTEACNLNCDGCWAGEYSTHTLPVEILDRVIDEAKDLGIYFIVLSGGEPFIYKPLLDVVEKHPEVSFMAFTNGTLIDDGVAQRLAALGNFTPAISLEGGREFTDARRGRGVFDQVMTAMDRLKREGVLFGFSVTATRHNVHDVFSNSFIDLMISKGAFYGWSFHYVPVGRNPSVDLMVTAEQRAWLTRRVPELRRQKGILLADFWNDGELTRGCIAGGRRYFHINANGDVEPCAFVHFGLDNIRGKSLKEVLGSPLFRTYQARQPFDGNLLRPCPIIDHPDVLKEIVERSNAHPTHEGAGNLFEGALAVELQKKAVSWKEASEPIWQDRQGNC